MRSVSRCRWCAATATFLLAVHVCSVCKGEAGEIEGLVPIILRARLIVPEPALSVVIPCTRGPDDCLCQHPSLTLRSETVLLE